MALVSNLQPNHKPPSSQWRKPSPVLRLFQLGFKALAALAPGRAAWLAYRLWFSPRRLKQPDREHQLLRMATDTYRLTVAGKRVAVHAWGKGPAILLVHGWEGRGAQLGAFIQPLTGAGYRVVAFDAPAHGASTGKQTDVPEISEVLLALQEREGGFAGLIAHSFGSVAAAYALRHGLWVDRAVMISAPARLDYMVGRFSVELGVTQRVMPRFRSLIEGRFPDLGARVWQAFNVDDNARHFEFSGLIIHDRDDRLVPISQGRKVAAAWPAAQWWETGELGHYRILRDQTVVGMAVDFLSGVAAADLPGLKAS